MGGALKSAGGFLGLSSGPQAPGGNFGNGGLDQLNQQNMGLINPTSQGVLNNAENGSSSVQSEIDQSQGLGLNPEQQQGVANQLATGATTGSRYATENVQNNPLLSQGLNDIQGQLQTGQGIEGKQNDILNNLQSQGFNLTAGDQSLYGQEAGQIANQFAQQGNQTANDLASRGLSNSGAAGAQFSGIAGNQNQMLANAQQQIAQQRFQNTQNQIAQQQNFIGSLNAQNNQAAGNYSGQAANDVNQQYNRQLAGAQNQTDNLKAAAGLQGQTNNSQNAYGLDAAKFNVANTPYNFMDNDISSLATMDGAGAKGAGQAMTSGMTGPSGGSGQSSSSGGGLFGPSKKAAS